MFMKWEGDKIINNILGILETQIHVHQPPLLVLTLKVFVI